MKRERNDVADLVRHHVKQDPGASSEAESPLSLRSRRQKRSVPCGDTLRVARDALGRAHRAQKKTLMHDELLEALEERVRRIEGLLGATINAPRE